MSEAASPIRTVTRYECGGKIVEALTDDDGVTAYCGHAVVHTERGISPVTFPIEAGSIGDAFRKSAAAFKAFFDRLVADASAPRLVVPTGGRVH